MRNAVVLQLNFLIKIAATNKANKMIRMKCDVASKIFRQSASVRTNSTGSCQFFAKVMDHLRMSLQLSSPHEQFLANFTFYVFGAVMSISLVHQKIRSSKIKLLNFHSRQNKNNLPSISPITLITGPVPLLKVMNLLMVLIQSSLTVKRVLAH